MPTREEILAMEAGVELDALVARHIFDLDVRGDWTCYTVEGCIALDDKGDWIGSGYDRVRPVYRRMNCDADDEPREGEHTILGCLPHTLDVVADYSTSISDAWQVVEKMRADGEARGQTMEISVFRRQEPKERYPRDNQWQAEFAYLDVELEDDPWVRFHEKADTAPLAICRAALIATLEGKPCA